MLMMLMLTLGFAEAVQSITGWVQRPGNERVGLKGFPADADDARCAVR